MSHTPQDDLIALSGYANALESFKSRITRHCDALDAELGTYSCIMMDAGSRKALHNSRRLAADIKACLFPVDRLLEIVNQMIGDKEQSRNPEL